ncbi:MAG: FIST N-terminal domain-containing protein [Gemmobacter sp.]
MDGHLRPAADGGARPAAVRSGQVRHGSPDALRRLAAALGPEGLSLAALFVTPEADFAAVMAEARLRFPGVTLVGCTTAGEIGQSGYLDGEIAAFGLTATHFDVETVFVDDLGHIDTDGLAGQVIRARHRLAARHPQWSHEFAFLLVDGLSIREDELVAALTRGLGPVPLFGGSAGDGTRFKSTRVALGARTATNAAVLSLVRTGCPVKVFSLDHLTPTDRRMVVTEADPARRIVRQINAEPAAREYARLLGKDPEQLSTFIFAAHPVVVRLGGTHHVRAIRQVLDNGDLVFFSAIGEGLVLRLAEPKDMAAHLDHALDDLARDRRPEAILACDCILRRVEAGQLQKTRAVSDILARHRVIGFSTYGEQFNGIHVNHTMTGVAIYAPGDEGPA